MKLARLLKAYTFEQFYFGSLSVSVSEKVKEKMEGRLVQSQPPMSNVKFHWVCLFNWCEDEPKPFECVVREATKGIIPESWFSKPLSEENRQQKATFRPMDSQMSVFAKIEFGKRIQLAIT